MLAKPRDVFDRDQEWEALTAFATESPHNSRLGIVYGRRRQGKSWLLERLCQRVRGFYWEAIDGTARQQLDGLAESIARWTNTSLPPRFENWASAIDTIWRIAPSLVVFDEFQYLVSAASELPSVLQARVSRAFGPRMLVCGSAMGAMQRLPATDAPLRGRASLELVLQPFDFRSAARYWGVGKKWDQAARLHSLVGGTPAYRNFVQGRIPGRSFEEWLTEVLLNPSGALFREGRILADDAPFLDRSLYHGVLSAVAAGHTKRGQIAAALGRAENTLAHPLNSLVELTLLERVDDPLRARRSFFRLAEPMLRTYQAIIAPYEGAIERRGAKMLLPVLLPLLSSRIEGPHFETLAREWLFRFASKETLECVPTAVGPSTVSDPTAKRELEIDAVVCAGNSVVALGEAKWASLVIGRNVLSELEHKRALLGGRAKKCTPLPFRPERIQCRPSSRPKKPR